MEAFGRAIAVSLGAMGLVVFLLFYKTATVRWLRTETVRNMSRAYAEDVLNSGVIRASDWNLFREMLNRFGNYRTEFAVFERRRFEGENGRIYFFTEEKVFGEDKLLTEGSYIRITVTEETGGKAESMLYGSEGIVIAGGRVE